jgi:hypothetical protein
MTSVSIDLDDPDALNYLAQEWERQQQLMLMVPQAEIAIARTVMMRQTLIEFESFVARRDRIRREAEMLREAGATVDFLDGPAGSILVQWPGGPEWLGRLDGTGQILGFVDLGKPQVAGTAALIEAAEKKEIP